MNALTKTDRLSSEAIQAVLAPTCSTCPHPMGERDLIHLARHGFTRVTTFGDGKKFDRVVDTMEIIEFGRVHLHREVRSVHAVLSPELAFK